MDFENLDEKYKPTKLADVIGQDQVVRRAQSYVRKGQMPHLMLAGPPGVGKTSVVIALAHELFGENWRSNLSVFNASTQRGIKFIREDIANLTMIEPVGSRFQIIFLDEADELTSDAQGALREIMQAHTATTKFILGCNYINNLIEPIQDRCRVFRFGRLKAKDILTRISYVAKQENADITDEALVYIAEHSKNSLRSALQHLESYIEEDIHVTLDIVQQDLVFVDDEDAKFILSAALQGDINKYEDRLFKLYYDGGFSSDEILDSMLNGLDQYSLSIESKKKLIYNMGEYNWRMSQGSNELLQMRCFLRTIEGLT